MGGGAFLRKGIDMIILSVAFGTIWAMSAVVAYKIAMDYTNSKWPTIKSPTKDRLFALCMAVFGPISLIDFGYDIASEFKSGRLKWK